MKEKILIGMIEIGVLLIAGFPMAEAYVVKEVPNGGIIKGQVIFSGPEPTPLHFSVEKNPEFCGQQRSLLTIESHDGFLAGSVVVLEGVQTGKPFTKQGFLGKTPGMGEFHYEGGGFPWATGEDQRL